jgi:peroxiredoxin
MRRSLFLLVFILNIYNPGIVAETVIIQGNNPDYAGQTLNFAVYENQITNNEKTVATIIFDKSGNFKAEFNINKTEFVFAHAGVFFVYFYAEPQMSYTFKLPPRTDKKQDEKLNPYFEEANVHLILESARPFAQNTNLEIKNELNFLIRTFDDYFDPFYTKFAVKVYKQTEIAEMDTTLQKMQTIFGGINHPYFKAYYNYRMGLLKFTSTRFKSKNISDNYFLNKPVLYDNQAYMELFNHVYDKYFVYFGRSKTGKVIYDDINTAKSLTLLEGTLSQDKVLSNDTLKELVILKGIHDGFYEMEFSRAALLQILDSLSRTTKIEKHKAIAKDIREKVTRLLVGYVPPPFKLLNQDSAWVSLNDFKGSYVYICFCTTQNYACLKEFDSMKKIQEKHGKTIKIITISVDDVLSEMRSFVKKSKYTWLFLHYGAQPDIIKEYDIRAFPTFYFIDKDGKLAMSPAPSPSEYFEEHLFKYLQSKKSTGNP